MLKLLLLIFLIHSQSLLANDSIKSVVEYLASDKLEGRKAGQNGNELATQYLITQMQSIGLTGFAGEYTQDFTIFTEMTKTGPNYFRLNKGLLPFEPISYSLSGEALDRELVFAGFGITLPETDPNFQYDDYKNIDVKNKIVVIMTGDPAIGNPSSVFRKPEYLNYSSLFYKLKNAITHGAVGVILITDPLSLPNYPEEDDPSFNASEGGGNRFSILSGTSTNYAINKYLKNNSTLEIQKKIAKTQKPFSFALKSKASLAVNLKKKTGRVSNIVGVLKGSDEKLSREVIVIGAHMDHLGFGGESSMEPGSYGKIHNGADDNASGTAMVLELAKKLKDLNHKRTYIFILFNAEEMGLLGASHFVNMWQAHAEDYGEIKGMLNFDMIGRYQKELSIMGADSALEWKQYLNHVQSNEIQFSIKNNALGSSDHAVFLNQKIPALFFTTGAHEDYHRPSDDSDKIDFKAMRGIYHYSIVLLSALNTSKTLTYNPNYASNDVPNGSRGYGAHLGCVPEFGQSDDIIGVLCVDTSVDSPARMAGMQAGDVLIAIGDIEIKNIYDLAFALKYYRAGDKITLAWKRGDQLFKTMITLARSRRS